ncbi:hypothetical protein K439DRAFT_1386744 [Ramaria rubella]|nr:hypothetical protein K439DRAFT_1386744 [Ramaria rubella]
MPACGCPDVKLPSGETRKCDCQPCSKGNFSECTCNKETGCACSKSNSNCVCGLSCTCVNCTCEEKPAQKIQAGNSCCGHKVE